MNYYNSKQMKTSKTTTNGESRIAYRPFVLWNIIQK